MNIHETWQAFFKGNYNSRTLTVKCSPERSVVWNDRDAEDLKLFVGYLQGLTNNVAAMFRSTALLSILFMF